MVWLTLSVCVPKVLKKAITMHALFQDTAMMSLLTFLCISSAGKVEVCDKWECGFGVCHFNTRLVAVCHELCACLQAVLDLTPVNSHNCYMCWFALKSLNNYKNPANQANLQHLMEIRETVVVIGQLSSLPWRTCSTLKSLELLYLCTCFISL